MDFEALYDYLPCGWLEKEEARLLYEIAQSCEGPILEVGCHWGRSTVLLASLGRPVYSVDPFTNFDSDDREGLIAFERFHENMHLFGLKNVQQFQMKIEDWKILPVGFAYLDGDHTFEGTNRQIEAALNAGAVEMCIHDYNTSGGGLEIKRAIEGSPLELIRVVDRMAYCRKWNSEN